MTTLRCITIRHPWAFACVFPAEDRKDIENRSRGAIGWRHRGLTVVHAGAGWSARGADDPRIIALLGGRPEPDDPRFAYKACIGVFELEDIHQASGCCEPWGESEYRDADGNLRRDVTHLIMDNQMMLPTPVPCNGKLGIWWPPRPVEAAIEQQLWAAA